ncbi:coniferyl aldehyde dehydrogenase [Herbaspirillum sp. HC18]|nr:coniferyl aldehyde dehydrogenase [Herbaspirillum sp. HC18]
MQTEQTLSHASAHSATDMRALFDLQYSASRAQPDVDIATRLDRVARVGKLIDERGAELIAAVDADFGNRSPQLTEIADMFVLRGLLGHTRRELRRWMRPKQVSTPFYLRPARAMIMRQPLGVVGIIAPWNYPLQLSLGPAITALAAGNRILLKPSEFTPRTSALLGEVVGEYFAPDEFAVVQGDGGVAAEFSRLPFDHLFFTGSTAVGRKVAEAAAANLTPTTLELGGKSPCIIDASCDLDDAAIKIAHGKLLNGGQTCIAPDYILLPKGMEERFAAAFTRAAKKLFPSFRGNRDYASIINDRHHARLASLLASAQEQGARVVHVEGGDAASSRQMPPALVFNVHPGMRLMQDEIFGPVLPVVAYDSLEGAIDYINAGPRPLALYWFGGDNAKRDRVLAQTVSGGVTVNDTLLHIAHKNLPFGGVGDSGWGSYHGEQGFLRFTHEKAVLVQSRLAMAGVFYPPYGKRFDAMMALLRRWL